MSTTKGELFAGVTVALAPDWSMGGSQNLLDELRFARAWDESHWGKVLTDRDLLEMTTTRAAKVLALETRIGRIEPGYLADLAVFEGDRSNPYAALLAATPKNVILTIVGGTVLYGEAALVSAGPLQPGCEALEVCGRAKFLCAANTQTTDKLNQTYATFRAALEQALAEVDLQLAADGGADAGAFSPLTPLVKCP